MIKLRKNSEKLVSVAVTFVTFSALLSSVGCDRAASDSAPRIDVGDAKMAAERIAEADALYEGREDLAKGDDLTGVLRTGDLARKDKDEFFYITGRLKRFLKLFGKRFSLDEMERIVQQRVGVPVACFGNDDLLMIAIEGQQLDPNQIAAMVCSTFSLPRPAVLVTTISALPRTSRGKLDYSALARITEGTAATGKPAVQFAERTLSS